MEIVKIYNPGNTVEYQKYSNKDEVLVVSTFSNSKFFTTEDIVELVCYGQNNELVDYVVDLRTYKPLADSVDPVDGSLVKLQLDPKFDANNIGITRGTANLQYNFLKPLFNSSFTSYYWIKQISPSRREIKLSSQYISNETIREGFSQFQSYVTGKPYYVDFYLNFGQNRLVIANNAAIIEEGNETHLLIKLYEPLPIELDVKDTLWICDKVSDSVIFNINIDVTSEPVADENALRGPNTRLKIDDKKGQTTPYYNYDSLFSSNVTSSIQQLRSYYEDKAIEINVDYSSFSNFIHFSSATERVNNFVYKLELIESYQQEIEDSQNFASMGSSTLFIVSQSNSLTQQKIDNIIDKFDLYEYYLYFSSESFAWPKVTDTKPYLLYSVTSSQVIDWLGDKYTIPTSAGVSILYSASLYDDTNPNRLANAIPQYLLDDPNNEPYLAFIDMVGQHFDNVWLYYKDISNRYSSFNNPNLGLSKDMVADALTSFGFNLYTNTSVSDNLYYTLFGINPDGSLLPPTGSELITNYVTSSIETLSPKELDSEVYKRLYHNLSYLLKTKGTQRGVKALICSYGIPESILTVNEFGGNSRYTGSGIYEINNQKINYFTQSAELSNPVLSPYITLQQYNTDYRLNILDIESGFSPSNTINTNFVSSSGFVNMDQLIGNPEHQYLQYYPDLKTVSDNYFASYNYPHSIWEYIRIIKYYNNSLFKTIKDWVPAKSSTSTGIVIKSHVLERNKYARHEPSMSFDNNISESIDMISISGSAPGAVVGSTQYTENVITPLGYASLDYQEDKAKITGRLSGSFIQATNGEAFDQSDYSTTASGSIEVDFPANYQNVITANRSVRFFELDYAYNQNTPVNLGLITQSISNSIDNNYNTYNDPYAPYTDIQDYNYYTRAFTDARYYGSRLQSATYNKYTAGDTSYGKTAAIDKEKLKYAYLVDIYTSSIFLPGRSNAQIKYIIDNDRNVLNLTKANFNIFDVQNLFRSGETCDVSLFEYDESNPYSQLLANNPTLKIYEGGWRYLPILHNLTGSSTITQSFTLNTPIEVIVPAGGTQIDTNNYELSASFEITDTQSNGSETFYGINCYITAVERGLGQSVYPYETTVNSYIRRVIINDGTNTVTTIINANSLNTPTIPANEFSGSAVLGCSIIVGLPTGYTPDFSISYILYTIPSVTQDGGSSGSFSTYYTTNITSSVPCLFFNTSSQQLVFNSTIAQYYEDPGITFNSTSDPGFYTSGGLDTVILPFNLTKGDKISIYDAASNLGWSEKSEYTVLSTSVTGSGTGSRLLVETVPNINTANFNSGSIDSVTQANFKTCRYIVWKHVPDETNVMLRYNPKSPTIVEEGLLFPQYITDPVKNNAGNVVKSLKSDNLI